jgi:hypothetical protein
MPRGKRGSWEHGTESGYQHCGPLRCDDCKAAHREYNAERREQRAVPATPRPRAPRRPSAAQRQAFQGAPYDPAKAAAARRDIPRAPLTDAERVVLGELLRQRWTA